MRLHASFEHEFQLLGDDDGAPAAPFSLEAQRLVEPFGPLVMAALAAAGAEPDTFLPEYGPRQFEVSCDPAEGVAAADRAVIVREVIREVARRLGRRATFAPLTEPESVGNGVHVHFGLLDDSGRPALYDADRPGRLSGLGASFAAGVLRHAPALVALTAPSAISGLRLTPHRWSAGIACLGERNRETLLRICPGTRLGGADPARGHHLEYRAADAAAGPHLALAAIVRAGLEGVRAALPCPPVLDRDPATLDAAALRELDAPALPCDLPAALAALEGDAAARGWLPPRLLDTYLLMKRSELAAVAELDPAERCRRYAEVY
jgi:glutamine synthetase